MIWSNLFQRIIFLSLTAHGIVGNVFVFVRHLLTFVMGPEQNPIDLILIHLAFTNAITVCSTGIRDMPTYLYLRNFLDEIGCKTFTYMDRVARGLSICTTCLLSVVQAVSISPRTTPWRKLKPHTACQLLPYLLLFWVFNSLINSNLPHYITAESSTNRSGIGMYIGYCYMLPSRQIVRWFFLSIMALRDIVFQSLMGWSSGYMAFYLYKHHKRVRYLHISRSTNNSSPEIRATLSILILMTCFLFFYWADSIFSFYIGSTLIRTATTLNIKTFLGLGYASLSPLVLISRDVQLVHCWHSLRSWGNRFLC